MCWHIVMQQNPTACSPNFLAVFTMETSAICLMHYHHILSESRFMLLSMNKTHNFTFVAYSIKNIFNDNGATCITQNKLLSHQFDRLHHQCCVTAILQNNDFQDGSNDLNRC